MAVCTNMASTTSTRLATSSGRDTVEASGFGFGFGFSFGFSFGFGSEVRFVAQNERRMSARAKNMHMFWSRFSKKRLDRGVST